MSDTPSIIYPWEETGWPMEIFKASGVEIARRDYMCARNRCRNVLKDPIQLECGDRVCKECRDLLLLIAAPERVCHVCKKVKEDEILNRVVVNGAGLVPPNCIDELERNAWIVPENCNPDRAAAMEIDKLEVKCPYGCDTDRVGTRLLCIRELKKHMRECLQRLVACGHCAYTVSLSELHTHLDLHTRVDCLNGCGTQGLQRGDLADHDLVCDRRTSAAVSCTQDVLQALCVVQDKQREYEDRQRQFEDWKRESANENRSLKEQVKNEKEERKRDKLINDAYIDFLMCEKQNLCPGIGTPPVSLVKITEVSIDQIINLTARPEYQKEDGKGTLIFGLAGADLQTCEGSKWKFSIPCCIKSSGLTFRVGVKPYGCGQAENSYMFVCFVRMNGGDELDTQPEFNLQLTLALRNLENKEHIVKTFSPMVFTKPTDDQHVAYGCLKFVPRQKLETGNGYIKEDMLILQISVREIEGGIAQAL